MSRTWRFFATFGLDVLIVLAAVVSAVGTALRTDDLRPDGAALAVEMAAIAAVILVLLARRSFPFAAPAALWVGSATLSFFDGKEITSQPGVFVSGLVAAALLGASRRAIHAGAGLALVLGGAALVVYNDPTYRLGELVSTAVVFGVGWGAGLALRDRAEQASAAEERARRAERERESAARLAVAEERARMARELHDVVAHAVSVMVLQVGAVRHRMPDSAVEQREALGNVEQAGRTALAEMRRMLGALRSSDDEPELTPHPGLGDLESLARDVRAAGLDVRLHVQGDGAELTHALDLSAFRIVQEGLTNALKHADARHVEVTVQHEPDRLRIEVRDDGRGRAAPGDGLGRGLIGIGERVKIFGGEMSTFVAVSGGFVLRVSLPVGDGEEA